MRRSCRITASAVGMVLLVGMSVVATADDWPNWRGPANDGISAEKGWSPSALTEGKVLWRANVGKGHSSFAVANGKAYTMGNADNQDTVFCFDAVTGKQIWRSSYACSAGSYPGPRSTPAVDDGRVFTVSREGHLHCFDAESGKVKWKKKVKSGQPKWGIATSPIVNGDLVVLNAGTSGTAYRKKTGKLAWSGGGGIPGYASPVPMGEGKSLRFLIFSEKDLICVSGKSGRPKWSFPWQTKYNVNAGDPVLVGESSVFISSSYGKGCALLEVGAKGVRKIWQNTSMKNHMGSAVLVNGHLYGFDDSKLACLDEKNGAQKWSKGGFGKGGLMLADGKLIILSERGGSLVIAEAAPEGYKELARAQVLDGHTWTAPVLANGRIYCRNDAGDIACVDVSGK